MKYLIIISSLLFFISCNEQRNQSSSKLIKNFDVLFGQVLECEYEKVKTTLLYLSPHIIGIPINENGFQMEYFHSVGSKKESNSLFYESSFKGKSNFQTKQSESSKDTRRLKVTINEEKLFITAINQIDEKMIPINPVLYECQIKEKITFDQRK